jgi:hypothetical protein
VTDTWLWVERASWVVVILGIPGLILGLLTLGRRPGMRAGFAPTRKAGLIRRKLAADHEIRVQPQNGRAVLNFVIFNNGRATARDLTINFAFPPGVPLGQVVVPGGSVITRSEDDRVVWVWRQGYLHPGDLVESEIAITISMGTDRLRIEAAISMADSATVTQVLVVKVEARGLSGPSVSRLGRPPRRPRGSPLPPPSSHARIPAWPSRDPRWRDGRRPG